MTVKQRIHSIERLSKLYSFLYDGEGELKNIIKDKLINLLNNLDD